MLHWLKRAASGIANASPGKVRLFVDAADGTYKQKDENGVVKVLGNGIKSIALQSTSGLTKTYRITRDDNSIFDFSVTDGRSINTITAPATPGVAGALDTYTINYNDGSTSTFVVRNGTNGLNGTGQPAANAPTTIQPDATGAIGTRTDFYALEDHRHEIDAATAVGLNGGSESGEGTSTSFARADHTHAIANGGTPSTITPDAAADQGTSTSLARSDHTHAIAADVPVALGAAAAEGTSSSFSRADHVHLNPVIAHEGSADPHPQYTTTAEAAAAAPVQSVNGQTGAVTVAAGTDNKAETRSSATASASTAVTTIQSHAIADGEIVPGSEYEFWASLRVINTTTATNIVVTLSVGATNVLVLTQALGTTARASPGGAVEIYGRITFYSTTQAECYIRAFTPVAVAFDAAANTSAPITVSAAGATTLNLQVNTSGATSTFIARQATIQRIK